MEGKQTKFSKLLFFSAEQGKLFLSCSSVLSEGLDFSSRPAWIWRDEYFFQNSSRSLFSALLILAIAASGNT